MRRELCWGDRAIAAAFGTTRATDGCREEIAAAEVWEDLGAWCAYGEASGGSRRSGGSKVGGVGGCSDGWVVILVEDMLRWVGRAAPRCCSSFGRAALRSACCIRHVDGRKGAADRKGELGAPC